MAKENKIAKRLQQVDKRLVAIRTELFKINKGTSGITEAMNHAARRAEEQGFQRGIQLMADKLPTGKFKLKGKYKKWTNRERRLASRALDGTTTTPLLRD